MTIGLGAVVVFLWLHAISDGIQLEPVTPNRTYLDASARYALAIVACRIDDFMRTELRAPESLADIGDQPLQPILYERVADGRYRLTVSTMKGPIRFDSMLPRDSLEGRGREALGRPPGTPTP